MLAVCAENVHHSGPLCSQPDHCSRTEPGPTEMNSIWLLVQLLIITLLPFYLYVISQSTVYINTLSFPRCWGTFIREPKPSVSSFSTPCLTLFHHCPSQVHPWSHAGPTMTCTRCTEEENHKTSHCQLIIKSRIALGPHGLQLGEFEEHNFQAHLPNVQL